MSKRNQIMRKKKILLSIYSALLCILVLRRQLPCYRSYYIRPVNLARKQKGEWHQLIQELRDHDAERHFSYFRMAKEGFDYLVNLITPELLHANTCRDPITPEERLPVTLR